ncbi:hypothetical protein [Streptomyces halobius]|uniref:hypothetical protein n=1 Tax=Streptomyces halobius TaxID=2879846 RepID=UPI0029E82328|nr:hypothetical protein [Streptomyces halobius]
MLTGLGGVGKSRLALRGATILQDRFSDGVWLVEPSALRDPEVLEHAFVEALALTDQTVRPPRSTTARASRRTRTPARRGRLRASGGRVRRADRGAAAPGAGAASAGRGPAAAGAPGWAESAAAPDELCTPQERLLWARPAVLAGQFDPEAAEYACSGPELRAAELADVVAELVVQSLLVREETPAGALPRASRLRSNRGPPSRYEGIGALNSSVLMGQSSWC